ncbi:MAG: 5-carboxymethyl-2-hydroxymuconate isomerase [Gammaproteobacteria bacterium]|nr:5-carboxymethyl-2-hydroxymuconate isomerase [Gammaproteobacteria bacterium]|tara:strand:- start:347 stop:1192 length:846 start_codon:yes stop_codon:yes gene_type:complete
MRWLSFIRDGAPTFGYLTSDGAGVVDVGARGKFADLKSAIAADALDELAGLCGDAADLPLEGLVYLPTVPNPDKILCVGLNYKAHQEETGRGGEGFPTIFVRFANAQVGHGQPMIRPKESNTLDYEGEIALVIGKAGRRIPKARALDHVAGYSIYNDGSVREYQRQTTQFTPGKNFPSTGGFGPWMVTRDDVADIGAMEITTRLNGEVMQNATADLLVFDFGDIIEYCSTFCELTPGDVIVTGTPGGVGAARTPPVFMDEGDEIEVEVKPIGVLRHRVTVG